MTKSFLTLFTAIICTMGSAAQAADYHNATQGVSFTHPDIAVLDNASGSDTSAKIPFTIGEPPFNVSVLLKNTGFHGSIDEFMAKEHQQQKDGGYAAEMTEKAVPLASGETAYELTRVTPYGTIYYFIFPILKSDEIMALWLMTSPDADPENKAYAAYTEMRDSLTISE